MPIFFLLDVEKEKKILAAIFFPWHKIFFLVNKIKFLSQEKKSCDKNKQ